LYATSTNEAGTNLKSVPFQAVANSKLRTVIKVPPHLPQGAALPVPLPKRRGLEGAAPSALVVVRGITRNSIKMLSKGRYSEENGLFKKILFLKLRLSRPDNRSG
jgi:hypothetical protein